MPGQASGQRDCFLFLNRDNKRCPLQLGLEVIIPLITVASSLSSHVQSFVIKVCATVLGDPSKAMWKNCVVSAEEEQRLADESRLLFGAFDFTLEDENGEGA